MLKRWTDNILGDPNKIGLENRFNHLVALLSGLIFLIATSINLFMHLGVWLSLATLLGFVLMLFIYWLSRFRGKFLAGKWMVTLVLFIILDFLWYLNSGSAGPILYIFIVYYSMLIFIWEGKTRRILMVFFFINLCILGWIEYKNPGELVNYKSELSRIIDIYSSLALYALIATALLIAARNVFLKALEKAQHSDRLKSAFLANMSHEIRTPMNSILGFSQLLDEDISSEERKRYVRIISENSIYLLQLIEDIIDISKIEAEQIEIYPRDFRLKELMEELQSIFLQALIKENKTEIALYYRIPYDELVVRTDKTRLKQVLFNLLTNAVKFTDSGKIEFGCEIKDDQLEFYTKDTGIGIHPDYHTEIFERFFKLESKDPAKVYRGTGIGLAITKCLVEHLGGTIRVDSEPGKGSEFRFNIPHLVNEPGAKSPGTPEGVSALPDWEGRTLLVAEDEETNYLYLKEVLKKTGVSLLWVSDGLSAVKMVEEHPEIDLVLMDIKMPLMNGLEATRAIKKQRPALPVVAQTAYAMEGDEDKSLDAGCDAYLAKPIRMGLLIEVLQKFLAEKKT